jgi:HD-GYP domain-containing protein (c-di-GMP phosphodiesterase class II)
MPASQADAWRNRLRELMAEGLDVPAAILLETAREAIRDEMSEAWRAKTSDALVSCAARFSQQVVDLCAKRDEMADALASIAVHDGNTFAHSTNVCTYVVMLAQASGISSNCTLLELGQAALLHDLGKRRVHAEILNKPGPLSLAERETMNDHPRIGFQDLCRQPNLTREQLLMVYQHHERIDGGGYPVGLSGDAICWTAQMCSVVDVYDAYTAQRSYREAIQSQQALAIIRSTSGTQLCTEHVECWNRLVSRLWAVAV